MDIEAQRGEIFGPELLRGGPGWGPVCLAGLGGSPSPLLEKLSKFSEVEAEHPAGLRVHDRGPSQSAAWPSEELGTGCGQAVRSRHLRGNPLRNRSNDRWRLYHFLT